jgi:hypothetical protein
MSLTHTVTGRPHDEREMRGANTKTDVEPMSTSEFKGHIARGRKQLAK